MVFFDGQLRPSVAFFNQEAHALGLPDNFWASALWHYVIRAKGEKRQPSVIKGTVAVITGDDEWMEVI